MRILYLAYSLDPSTGWGRFSRELVTRFVDAGVEAHVLTEHKSDFPNSEVGLERSFGAIRSARKIRQIVKEKKIDIVHSLEMNPYGISAYIANFGMNTKQVITATGAYSVRPLYQNATSFISNRVYKKADMVVPISKYVEDEIMKKVKGLTSKVITLGVDAKKFSGPRVASSKPFILSVGNLSPRKGYEVSVAAFAKVAKLYPELRYLIAGSIEKNVHDKCMTILRNENVDKDRVEFLGSLDDEELKKLYLSAELFILTSVNLDFHFEGYGLVFTEAASAGLPVIGTKGNGIGDAVLDGENGILVDQNNIDQTKEAILKIISDKDLKRRYSEASIKWASKNSWENCVSKYMKVYEEIFS